MDNITNKEREEDVFLWKMYCDGDISLDEWLEKSPIAKKTKQKKDFWTKTVDELGIEI